MTCDSTLSGGLLTVHGQRCWEGTGRAKDKHRTETREKTTIRCTPTRSQRYHQRRSWGSTAATYAIGARYEYLAGRQDEVVLSIQRQQMCRHGKSSTGTAQSTPRPSGRAAQRTELSNGN
ncbi:unnamed protein product [Ectocarpus sp. 12 AP-2014]